MHTGLEEGEDLGISRRPENLARPKGTTTPTALATTGIGAAQRKKKRDRSRSQRLPRRTLEEKGNGGLARWSGV